MSTENATGIYRLSIIMGLGAVASILALVGVKGNWGAGSYAAVVLGLLVVALVISVAVSKR